MGDDPGGGIDYDDIPAHFPGIVHRCAGSAAQGPVVDGQQQTRDTTSNKLYLNISFATNILTYMNIISNI